MATLIRNDNRSSENVTSHRESELLGFVALHSGSGMVVTWCSMGCDMGYFKEHQGQTQTTPTTNQAVRRVVKDKKHIF